MLRVFLYNVVQTFWHDPHAPLELFYHTSVEKLTESYILGSNISLFEIYAQKPTLSGKAATSPIAKMLGILVLNMESTYKEEPTGHLRMTKKNQKAAHLLQGKCNDSRGDKAESLN